jgi:transposase
METLLPLLPDGSTRISEILSVVFEQDKWTYFHGALPIFSHSSNDNNSFRMISSSFICEGVCRNVEVEEVFNVSKSSVIRNVRKYKKYGSRVFFREVKKRKQGKIFTREKIEEAGSLLSLGYTRSQTASQLGVKYDTLNKAIMDKRINYRRAADAGVSNKSQRSLQDSISSEVLGVGCVRVEERVLAAFGIINTAKSRFERCDDVSFGGVLTALPALEANGLYHKLEECFTEFNGYYSVVQVITLLGFMALCRIKTAEKLRWQPPGELGKLLGLDRIPEVRCLRNKLEALTMDGAAEKWGELLTKKWMSDYPDMAGALYVDGHVRLYGGRENLPKQYVSRERLCLRGVMDFWVNDMLGQPFFVVRTTVNPGMLEVLRNEIVPRLLKEVPNQPTEEMLAENRLLHRFIIVFDREGYSPVFFKEMWEQYRIACITYHKYPGDGWNENEFEETKVKLVNGEEISMPLAERGSFVGDKKNGLWLREIRKLTKNEHQTSIVSTVFGLSNILTAMLMFARWCQENFFNYMMQHFAIDLLSEYKKEKLPDTKMVISPSWRKQEKAIKSLNGKLGNLKKRFADFTLHPLDAVDTVKYRQWEKSKMSLAEEISIFEAEISALKREHCNTDKHVRIADLHQSEQFKAISPGKKQLTDTIKMISYRAETAMANIIAAECGTLEQARALLRDIFTSEADIIPDDKNKILTVRVHNLSTRAFDTILDKLLESLNETCMKFPGTNMILKYERIGNMVSSIFPSDQDS